MTTNFSTLPLKPELTENLASLNYQKMTPIQAKGLPAILNDKDVIIQSETGSGKTATFALGILNKIKAKEFNVQALVLCPTRELAEQVSHETRRLARGMKNIKILSLYGGVPFRAQAESLAHGVHIIIGTPGRTEDHINRQTIDLSQIKTMVIDEADKMLEMGFMESLENIIARTPDKKQAIFCSATFPKPIKKITNKMLKNPETIKILAEQTKQNISHYFYPVTSNKIIALQKLLHHYQPESCLVFCNTKQDIKEVLAALSWFGACSLHGDLEQRERDQSLCLFTNKTARVLVATDVAARGLDIEDLSMVINYQLPRDSETYTHRVGRTGRAGKTGIACSLHDESEHYHLKLLEDELGEISPSELPNESVLDNPINKPTMKTIYLGSGRKQKLRPGDILGTLTQGEITGSQIGKINIFATWALVAVNKDILSLAVQTLNQNKVKGKKIRASILN